MKRDNESFYKTELEQEKLKVTGEEPIKELEDKSNPKNRRLIAMALGAAIAYALFATGAKSMDKKNVTPEVDPIELPSEYNVYDWVEPEPVTVYYAPEGYTLAREEHHYICYKDITTYGQLTSHTDEKGNTIYLPQEGFTLSSDEYGRPIAVKTERVYASPLARQELVVPEGYVLVDGRCYRVNEPEKGMGR